MNPITLIAITIPALCIAATDVVLTNDPVGRIVRHTGRGGTVFLTNDPIDVKLVTEISTNWLPITLQVPNGDGTTRSVEKEVGVIVSNRYALVMMDCKTNKVLGSSEAMAPERFLIRDKAQGVIQGFRFLTNYFQFQVP